MGQISGTLKWNPTEYDNIYAEYIYGLILKYNLEKHNEYCGISSISFGLSGNRLLWNSENDVKNRIKALFYDATIYLE